MKVSKLYIAVIGFAATTAFVGCKKDNNVKPTINSERPKTVAVDSSGVGGSGNQNPPRPPRP